MELKNQPNEIKALVAKGDLKSAIFHLQQLAQGSPDLNAVLLQSAKLSALRTEFLKGTISSEEQDLKRNQISNAILEILSGLETQMEKKGSKWQSDVENTLDEIIVKHGISPEIHQIITAHRKSDKTYKCLWIDDNPNNDQMELQAIMSLGFECHTALNPYEAYAILKADLVDIIVTNSLKRLKEHANEGIDFCHFLYNHEAYSKIPVLLHSISFQKALNPDAMADMTAPLPKNIKNDFEGKNTLVIRDLIEEVVRIVFQHPAQQQTPSRPTAKGKATPSGGKLFG